MLVSAQVADVEDQIMDDVEDIAEGEDEGDATVETDEGTTLESGTEVTEGEKVNFVHLYSQNIAHIVCILLSVLFHSMFKISRLPIDSNSQHV